MCAFLVFSAAATQRRLTDGRARRPGTDEESVVYEGKGSGGTELSDQGDGIYGVDFISLATGAGAPPAYGLYRLDLGVVGASGGSERRPAALVVKLNTDIEPVDLNITTRSKVGAADEQQVSVLHPTAAAEMLTLTATTVMLVELRVRSKDDGSYIQPHQCMVRLRRDGDQVVFAAAPLEEDLDTLQVRLDVEKELAGKSGEYVVQVVLGDFFAQNTVVWDVASVKLDPRHGDQPAAEPLHGPKPTIAHTFREEPAMPSTMVSTAFTVLAAIPSLWLPLALARGGANATVLRRASPLGVLCSLGLFTCVAAILFAMAQFWLRTPLLRTLEQLASLAIVSVPLSVAALRAQAAAETTSQKAD